MSTGNFKVGHPALRCKEEKIIPTIWVISTIVLWLLVLGETGLLILLLQALGEIRQQGKVSPSTTVATNRISSQGLEIGTLAPEFDAHDQHDNVIKLTDMAGKWVILMFVSPSCSACSKTVEALNAFIQKDSPIEVLLIGGINREENLSYTTKQRALVPVLTPEPDLLEQYQLRGVPFAFVIDDMGYIRGKNFINGSMHLQDLLEESGVPVSVHL